MAFGVWLLAGCTTVENAAEWLTQKQTTPQEANSVAAAASLYTGIMPAATAYVKSASCNAQCKTQVATVSASLRKDLDDALSAEAVGDSAKVSVAIDAFNQLYPTLTSLVKK